jgi:transposase
MPSLLDGAGRSLAVVADKAYGSRLIRQRIAEQGALAVIPSKSNARKPIPHDANLYRRRNIVERFFCTMKDMRRLATRYEKLSDNFLAMVHIFAIRLWINCPHPRRHYPNGARVRAGMVGWLARALRFAIEILDSGPRTKKL